MESSGKKMKRNRILIPTGILLVSIIFAANVDRKKALVKIESAGITDNQVEISVLVKNTGKEDHNFPANCSLKGPDGKWLDLPVQFVFLKTGAERKTKFTRDLRKINQVDSVRVAVWERVDKQGKLKKRYAQDEITKLQIPGSK
jgi:hypothetical protein